MNLLVTAGNTQTPIDRVRFVTSGFSGQTGAAIARTAWGRGHAVTLLTSRPEALLEYGMNYRDPGERFTVVPYRTFDELATLLQGQFRTVTFDAVIHAAAVSDFISAGAFTPNPGTFFNARTGQWEGRQGPPSLTEMKAGKISSSEPELWVRLVKAPKLVDRFRNPWGFAGILVKFKLEVGIGEQELLDIAENSRARSQADLIVANTLEGASYWAYLGPFDGRYERVPRKELPERLLLTIEDLFQLPQADDHG